MKYLASNQRVWKPHYRLQIKTVLLLLVAVAVSLLTGCGQNEVPTSEELQQEVQQETESLSEPTKEPVNDTSESIPEPLPQPQADGTGINFEFPKDWIANATEGMQDLQLTVNDDGNRVLYGVLHGYMDAQEIISITLADSFITPGEFVTGYDLQYNVTLDDGTLLRLNLTATGFSTENSGDVVFDGIAGAYVYPEFENYYWSLDCENFERWGDWVYQITEGDIVQYYSISEGSLNDYDPYADQTDIQFGLDYTALGWPGFADSTWEGYYYDGGQFYHDEYGQYFCKVYGTTLYWDTSVNNWYYQSKDKRNCYRWNGTNYYVSGLDYSWAYDVNVTGVWYWIDSSGVSKANPPSEYTEYVQSEIERFTDDDFNNSIEEWTETYGYTVYQDESGQWTCEAPYGYWKYYPDEGRYGRWIGVIDIYDFWTGKIEEADVNVHVSVIKGYKISFYDERGSEEIAKISASTPDSYPTDMGL